MKRRAFTLVEIMVVMVILGVLASVAMRGYVDSVERMRGAEAIQILTRAYAGYQRLLTENEQIGAGNPVTWTRLGMPDANADPNAYFTYSIRPNGNNPNALRATRKNDNSRRIEISLPAGVITKTAPY